MTFKEWLSCAAVVCISENEARNYLREKADFVDVSSYYQDALPYEIGYIGEPYGICVRFVLRRE